MRCACGRACISAPRSSRGLHHLLWEIVDNAIFDEAMGGFATEVAVTLSKDGSASVWDNGRGNARCDAHPVLKIPGVEVIFTRLHAGGKFGNDNYAYSGGLHGVGASVVNALSKWLTVDIFRVLEPLRHALCNDYDAKEKNGSPGTPSRPWKSWATPANAAPWCASCPTIPSLRKPFLTAIPSAAACGSWPI